MLLRSDLLSKKGFAHAFPTRGARDGDLHALLGARHVVQVKQVHGGLVVEAPATPTTEADALVARAHAIEAIAVGVRVADCVPILLANTRSGDVAAVHAGWRGVVAHVVQSAVEALSEGPLIAAIGPCIGACCFEVGCDVAAQIERACDPSYAATPGRARRQATAAVKARVIVRDDGLRAYVDLRAAVRAQLLALGLSPLAIDDVPGCTKHDAERFHSYRRDGADSGRMLAAIATRR